MLSNQLVDDNDFFRNKFGDQLLNNRNERGGYWLSADREHIEDVLAFETLHLTQSHFHLG